MTQVLITNGGTHPPTKYALAAANMIVDDSALTGSQVIQAGKLRLQIAEVLEGHHQFVQDDERECLKNIPESILQPYCMDRVEPAVADVLLATQSSDWKDHYAKLEVQVVISEILTKSFATAQRVERLWHADQNPECAFAQTYKNRIAEGTI